MALFGRQPPSLPMPDPLLTPSPTLVREDAKTAKRFRRQIWWTEHRDGIGRGVVWLVIVLEVALGLVGLWKYADYYIMDYVAEQQLVLTFFEGTDSLASAVRTQAPLPIDVSNVSVLSSGDTYDVLAFLQNPNPTMVAEVSYTIVAGTVLDSGSVIVLQDSTYPLAVFGQEERPNNPAVVLDNVAWYRIDAHAVPDPVAWKRDRLNLVTKDIVHDDQFVVGDRVLGRTTFTLQNQSGFGYNALDVFVVLRRSGAPVGVTKTVLTNLLPLEQRFVQLNWFASVPSATAVVDIYPVVNLFDEQVYTRVRGDVEEDRRDIRPRFR